MNGAAAGFVHTGYAATVVAGIALMFVCRVSSVISDPADKQRYYILQGITLIGAVLGAKLAVLIGDALWPLQPFDNWLALALSGRSIVGALLVGFLVAEATKPLMRYRLPPNDKFAVVLPFSIGIGRLGCLLAGCCLGLPHEGIISMVGIDGISRYPTAVVELVFHFSMGGLLWWMWRRGLLFGRLFAFYLVAYGGFRFMTEFARVTEKAFWGLSAYQLFCVAMVAAGLTALWTRSGPRRVEWSRAGPAS